MKDKYIPNLTKQMAVCEANYARLLKLLPDIDDCQQRDFTIDSAESSLKISLKVTERFKFTTSLLISQHVGGEQASEQIQQLISPQLQVRMYHDARMAEVISLLNRAQLKGKYSYPNKEMYQVDEKQQLNDHLAQWLGHCLNHGYPSQEFFTPSISVNH